MKLWAPRLGVLMIGLTGIFAIEELQRRDKLLTVLAARENEIAALLTTVGDGDVALRDHLRRERRQIGALRTQVVALVLGGRLVTVQGDKAVPSPTLKVIVCELVALERASAVNAPTPAVDPSLAGQCTEPEGTARDLIATLFLKRVAEKTSSGDVFAMLVVMASLGGGLIRQYMADGRRRAKGQETVTHTLFRAFGGGIVCYLFLSGGATPFTGTNMTAYSNPATGALLGLVSGMFSEKVLGLLSFTVDSFVDRMRGEDPPNAAPQPTVVEPVKTAPSASEASTDASPPSDDKPGA